MIKKLKIEDFLKEESILFDVRSPKEYQKAHIPGAINIPLFSDEERHVVGTTYVQNSREEAVELALKLVGPKLHDLVMEAKKHDPKRVAKIYCWRGGMRSNSVAWLLETAGFQCSTLIGGYKNFRKWVLASFEITHPIKLLGGFTGSGKTDILYELQKSGEQVLDLEDIANHRGSSYGALGKDPQPSVEHFENIIAMKWRQLLPQKNVWIEDESRLVGKCKIPDNLFKQMRNSELIFLERSEQERIEILYQHYHNLNKEELIAATKRLEKQLGGQKTKNIVLEIQNDNIKNAIKMVLEYYDKAYFFSLQRRNIKLTIIQADNFSPRQLAILLVK